METNNKSNVQIWAMSTFLTILLVVLGAFAIQKNSEIEHLNEKIEGYEKYLSYNVSSHYAVLSKNLNHLSDMINKLLETKELNEEAKSLFVSQLMDISIATEELESLAIETNQFNNEDPTLLTSNNAYVMASYFYGFPTDMFPETEIEKIKQMQKLVNEWKNGVNHYFDILDINQDENEFIMEHVDNILKSENWFQTINKLDEITAKHLREWNIENIGFILFETEQNGLSEKINENLSNE